MSSTKGTKSAYSQLSQAEKDRENARRNALALEKRKKESALTTVQVHLDPEPEKFVKLHTNGISQPVEAVIELPFQTQSESSISSY